MPCKLNCNPTNPDYPCSGVIGEIMREPVLVPRGPEKCAPFYWRSSDEVKMAEYADWKNTKLPTGWENIPGKKTSDLFAVSGSLPARFNNPRWFHGYGCEVLTHPFYVTTTSEYGRFSPNPHTMPQMYFPRTQQFSKMMSAGGMYRNRTLNTSNTKSVI